MCCSVLQCGAGWYTVVHCVAVLHKVLRCVSVLRSVLQCVALCRSGCNVLQCISGILHRALSMQDSCISGSCIEQFLRRKIVPAFLFLCRNTATHTRNYTATDTQLHCNRRATRQSWFLHCNTLQHTATHCNRHATTLQQTRNYAELIPALQHTATHCNTLQHT